MKNIMKTKKILSGSLSVILAVSLCSCASAPVTDINEISTQPDNQSASKTINISGSKTCASGKDETVYVLANADGSSKEILVSAHLKNFDGSRIISDISSLSDIKMLKEMNFLPKAEMSFCGKLTETTYIIRELPHSSRPLR